MVVVLLLSKVRLKEKCPRWEPCVAWRHHGRRLDKHAPLYRIRRERLVTPNVCPLTLLEGASADLIDQQIFLCEQSCRLRVVHKLICYGKASIMRAVGAGTRIFELLERKPIMKSSGNTTPSASRDVVSFENVYFEYPGRKGIAVLQNFNLQLTVGESVAIV